MNQKAYKALEYYKIINMLTDKASSSMGKEICRKLEPSTDIDEIRHMQTQTRDALTRLFQKGNISFGSVKDVRGSLKRLEIGSSLGIGELLAICSLLENTNRVKAYSRSERGDSLPDSLDGMFEALEPLTPLTTEIRRCILSEDEISDDASSTLKHIRRAMKHEDYRRQDPYPALLSRKRKCPQLSAGFRYYHEKRTLLHSGQGRIQRTGSGYGTRSVLHRFYFIYRADGSCKAE